MEDFLHFLDRSPTVFHAAEEIMSALLKAGFTRLQERDRWELKPGKGYFLSREGALVAAFRTPKKAPSSAVLLASHLDSPCLKIKPHPEQENRSIGQWGTEVYGAPLLHSWLDRDLCLAGQIFVQDKKGKKLSHLVKLDETQVIIPQLALHLERTVNEKGLIVQKQDHLKPIFSLQSKDFSLEELLKKQHSFKTLLNFDLYLVPVEKAAYLGLEKELIASYRLDNLTSAYAALHALLHSTSQTDRLQAAFFWDHEEIGSMSDLGADSRFGDELLERICFSFSMNREDYFRMKSRSLCLSGDLAHGFHPNFSDKYDPQNAPLLGGGPVLKFNANQRYATRGEAASTITLLAQKHKVPLQSFASRSDIPSGSTVGPMMAAQLGIPTVDLGIASWAMHSIRETIAAKDEKSLALLFQAALEEELI